MFLFSNEDQALCNTSPHEGLCQTRSFYLWLLQVVVLIIILFLLLWFLLPPKSPKFTISDFNVPAFNDTAAAAAAMNATTTTSPAGQEILIHNTTISFRLEIENPNQDYTLSADVMKVTLYYGNDTLGETKFGEIVSLGKGKVEENGILNGDGELLQKAVQNRTATGMKNTELRMDLVSGVKYKMWFWKSKHHGVNMEGKVPVGKDGKMSEKKKLRLYRVHNKFKK